MARIASATPAKIGYDLVSEVGSPWALDGYGGRSFTDDVHLDHVHIGVRG